MDLALLRRLVGGVVATLPDHYTHRELGETCERLGLPEPPGEDGHSKRERVNHSLADLPDADLPDVAERILASGEPPHLDAAARNAIQDVLWAGQGGLAGDARGHGVVLAQAVRVLRPQPHARRPAQPRSQLT
jgi:hypothetical protein